ncbi:MAG: thiosulfate oxidation carrier complex protein SoxZ [Rhodoplanes sp.]
MKTKSKARWHERSPASAPPQHRPRRRGGRDSRAYRASDGDRLRRDGAGQAFARDILARFVAHANGETVFAADFRNGTSANPYLVFFVRVERTTEFEFLWTHETGGIFRATGRIDVS